MSLVIHCRMGSRMSCRSIDYRIALHRMATAATLPRADATGLISQSSVDDRPFGSHTIQLAVDDKSFHM